MTLWPVPTSQKLTWKIHENPRKSQKHRLTFPQGLATRKVADFRWGKHWGCAVWEGPVGGVPRPNAPWALQPHANTCPDSPHMTDELYDEKKRKISPKSIPNSEKQKQLPNTQWMKYVYCPALFTLEVGRASCNHGTNTVWKKRFSKSVCDTVANMPEARAKGSLPKELLSASLFTSST